MSKSNKLILGILLLTTLSISAFLLKSIFVLQRNNNKLLIEKNQLIDIKERHKEYQICNLKSFCLIQSSFLSNIEQIKQSLTNNNISYIVVIPPNACNACISSLFTEIKNSRVNTDTLFLLIDNDSNLLRKEWLSFGFKNLNIIDDQNTLINKCHLNKSPIVVKVLNEIDNFMFFTYDPGISISFSEFSELF